jgi:uncharacterized tellurite resistance protein B-like protein
MNIEDLTKDELVALAGLMREVIRADDAYSDNEREQVDQLAATLGEERFEEVFAEATRRFTSRGDVKEYAKTIERPGARRAIFDCLITLAAADGVHSEEEKPLRWLASWWDLGA